MSAFPYISVSDSVPLSLLPLSVHCRGKEREAVLLRNLMKIGQIIRLLWKYSSLIPNTHQDYQLQESSRQANTELPLAISSYDRNAYNKALKGQDGMDRGRQEEEA